MQLRVRDIQESAKHLAFEEPSDEINQLCSRGSSVDYQVRGPVEVELTHYRAGDDLFFNGTVRCSVVGVCARCLEEYTFPVDAPLARIFVPADSELGKEAEEGADLESYRREEIDLAPMIREVVLLSLPTQPLCRSDCRGLCSQCGANLNTAACQCSADRGDPRLAVLRSIKLHS